MSDSFSRPGRASAPAPSLHADVEGHRSRRSDTRGGSPAGLDVDGWNIARGADAVNVYDSTGRRLVSVRAVGDDLSVVTHRRGVVPLRVIMRAISLAEGCLQ